MSKFKVGEEVIINSTETTKHNGKVVNIIERYLFNNKNAYLVSPDLSTNGFGYYETALRKKPDDKPETTTWEHVQQTIGYSPEKEVV